MNPEEQARQTIDALLVAAGWAVQDFKAADIHAARGEARADEIARLPAAAQRNLKDARGNENSAETRFDRADGGRIPAREQSAGPSPNDDPVVAVDPRYRRCRVDHAGRVSQEAKPERLPGGGDLPGRS